jgi:branched-chain amino acid transport system ATP-binding protein
VSTLLQVEHLAAAYGPVQAVRDVSMTVDENEVVAIIGPNGAGKTTLLSALAGLLPATGTIAFAGRSIEGISAEDAVRLGMSLVPERRQLFGSMSVRDNLLLGAYHRFGSEPRSDIEHDARQVFALFPVLNGRAGHPAGTLSGGMQQMLAIGRGLMARPRLLLMDEPLLGLAPLVIKEIMRTLRELRSRGQGILIVEQNAKAALGIADRAYVMEGGQVVLTGKAAELAEDPKVRAAYLGGHVETPRER